MKTDNAPMVGKIDVSPREREAYYRGFIDGRMAVIEVMLPSAASGKPIQITAPESEVIAALTAEVERLKERETCFASRLGVADLGQYRADWDAVIARSLAAAREEGRRDTAQAIIVEVDRAIVKLCVSETGMAFQLWLQNLRETLAVLAALPDKKEDA